MPVELAILERLSEGAHLQKPAVGAPNVDWIIFMDRIGNLFEEGLSPQVVELALKYLSRDVNKTRNDALKDEIAKRFILFKGWQASSGIFEATQALEKKLFIEYFKPLLSTLLNQGFSKHIILKSFSDAQYSPEKMSQITQWLSEIQKERMNH